MQIQAIVQRRSIRRFKPEGVPEALLCQLLEAARQAPSGKNRQPWRFWVLGPQSRQVALDAMDRGLRGHMDCEPEEQRRGLASAIHTLRIMKTAPALILMTNPDGGAPGEPISGPARVLELLDAMSVGAAVENLLLEATALGLGALWIGNTFFAYDEIVRALELPGQLLGAVAVGWPDERPDARPRKSMDEIAAFLP